MSALPSSPLVSVEEYLRTVYEPDCDYVDGELEDRNVGEKDHAEWQLQILLYLRQRSREWGIYAIHEVRMQVATTRFRVPDICVYVGPEPEEQVFRRPPFLCIEILSPEDRVGRMQVRIDDYLRFGVKYVWLVDPRGRRAWIYARDSIQEARDGVLRTEAPDLTVRLSDILPV